MSVNSSFFSLVILNVTKAEDYITFATTSQCEKCECEFYHPSAVASHL